MRPGAWAAGLSGSRQCAGRCNGRNLGDRREPPNHFANLYRTADDRWLVLAFGERGQAIPALAPCVGQPERRSRPKRLQRLPRAATPCSRDRRAARQGFATRTAIGVACSFFDAARVYLRGGANARGDGARPAIDRQPDPGADRRRKRRTALDGRQPGASRPGAKGPSRAARRGPASTPKAFSRRSA